MILEQVQALPSKQLENSWGPWVKTLGYPAPWIVRLRDAWEVLQGRAEAVREMRVEDIAQFPDLIPPEHRPTKLRKG